MNVSNLEISMQQVVEDFEFFVQYRNSLTQEELVVSTINFEDLGIY